MPRPFDISQPTNKHTTTLGGAIQVLVVENQSFRHLPDKLSILVGILQPSDPPLKKTKKTNKQNLLIKR